MENGKWACDGCKYKKYDGMAEDTCYCRMQQGGAKLIFKQTDCVFGKKGEK